MMNHRSIDCFCPPQYYGEKCQFHADRLSVVLHPDLSQSISSAESDQIILLKLVVLLLFNTDEVLMREQLCIRNLTHLCICGENHSRVESFNYDDRLLFLDILSSNLDVSPLRLSLVVLLNRMAINNDQSTNHRPSSSSRMGIRHDSLFHEPTENIRLRRKDFCCIYD